MVALTVEHAEYLVDSYLQALQKQDLNAILALYAEDATVEDPVGSNNMRGRIAIEEFYRGAVAQPIVAQLTGPLRIAGDAVAFPFKASIEGPDGRFETTIIDVFRTNEAGKIAAMQAFWGPSNTSIS